MDFGADEQDVLVLAGADPRVGDRQPINEPAALIAHVDGRNVGEAELALQKDAVAGLKVVGGAGAVDDAIEVLRREARLGERLLRRLPRERDARIARVHPVARLDAAALHDPLVGRVHDLREIVVGDDARGDVKTGGEECGASHQCSGLRVTTKLPKISAWTWQ